jgi:hypothetical protein
MVNHKRVVKYFFLINSSIIICILGGLYLYDPMQIFHRPYYTKELHLHGNMRQQVAGIINNYDFDSAILGTSMLENTSSFEANQLFGGNFINLSISGSDFYERSIILKYLLAKKDMKRIIYSLDSFYLERRFGKDDYPVTRFNYLYDNNKNNDIKAYFNDKFLKCLFSFSLDNKCIGKKTTFEYPNAWFGKVEHSSRFGGLDNWFKSYNNEQIQTSFKEIVDTSNKIKNNEVIPLNTLLDKEKNESIQYINNTILDIVSKNKDTEFILVFPPYYRMKFAIWSQYNPTHYEIHKAVIEYLAIQSGEYSNLKVFGYENQDFLDDISNYKDLSHYHQSINSNMLHDFKNNVSLLTPNNVYTYIKQAEFKAQKFNIIEMGNNINSYLKSKPNINTK